MRKTISSLLFAHWAPDHEFGMPSNEDDEIDETLDESFPASDPPSWNSGHEEDTEDDPEST